jgi:hypothetical protein
MSGGWPSNATPTGPRAFVPTSAAAAYGEACAFLKGRESRRLTGAATKLVRRATDAVAVQYHTTDVVTYHANGQIEIWHGGWSTPTTREKIRAYCPRVSAWCHDHVMYVARNVVDPDPLVEVAKQVLVEAGEADQRIYLDGEQPALKFVSRPMLGRSEPEPHAGQPIVLWPDGLLAYADETHEQAVARVEAWRNRPPEPKRTRRSTARNPNPNQLSMPL